MSKPITLSKKIRLFFLYLKHNKDSVVVNCAFCQSTNVKFKKQSEQMVDAEIVYKSEYICMKCGSTCKNTQYWRNENT